MKHYIGIDIGAKGFVAVVDEDADIIATWPLFDNVESCEVAELSAKLMRLCEYEDNCHVVMEDLHALFGASAGSTFKLGGLTMATEGIIATLGLPYTKVQAKKWQKEMFEGIHTYKSSSSGKTKVLDTKLCSIAACKRLSPGVDLLRTPRCSRPDDNKADAICMAFYCKRKFK